jgi:FixJ family two-component response regulator
MASEQKPIVFIIDDDEAIRLALARLFRSVGLQTETLGSAREFLQSKRPDVPSCLVLDVRLPGLSGLDFQAELTKANIRLPIVFMSGHGDVPMTVRAMKGGAIDFFAKPFRDQDILDAVLAAVQRDRERRESEAAIGHLRSAFESMSPREQEVMTLVSSGLMSKQVAAQMHLAEITVKIHRAAMMKKMGARSLAELVRMADTLGVRRTRS